ncbi:glycosyltransferase involved in cell wall biosynthesis [Flavobacterium sp. 1]|uniref:glycosyltransferase n=1 Tax=Flavobacterium sp. 1 TaxID=2035200 RepID=UPI000C23C71D|nr:glycosyltransferase [Flavobacterium sp. 1]PJJ10985.1 glycosyltransferase involved in cell wall biosynthesis [Flavobacterium sp. 1]
MRIIQLIDSLEAGGSERMAVSYANTLANKIEFSALVATRKEGDLLHQINQNVSYLFLNKKKQLDFVSLFNLRSFVIKNKITHIHAHSTSFFFASLLKLICPSVKLIWHYHYGNNKILPKKRIIIFRIVMPFFGGVIAVNQNLRLWIENNLKSKNTIYLPNFPVQTKVFEHKTQLFGIEGKRIISLANLREDKNHFLLLEVAQKLKKTYPDWTFHLVGKDFGDDYSNQIKKLIAKYGLEKNVFLYGSKQDIGNILNQTSIAILTSKSEGLPVALLEYGLYKKAVVVTDVGEIATIIQHGKNGFIVDSNEVHVFYQSLLNLVESETLRTDFGEALFDTIQADYIAESVMEKYLKWLEIS